jgi:hypothetical protein
MLKFSFLFQNLSVSYHFSPPDSTGPGTGVAPVVTVDQTALSIDLYLEHWGIPISNSR